MLPYYPVNSRGDPYIMDLNDDGEGNHHKLILNIPEGVTITELPPNDGGKKVCYTFVADY